MREAPSIRATTELPIVAGDTVTSNPQNSLSSTELLWPNSEMQALVFNFSARVGFPAKSSEKQHL